MKSVPAGTRSEKNFLIDPSIGDDITIDMNGRWNCIRSRSTLVSKDDYQVVNYDSNTDALYQKRRVGRSYRKFTIERKEVYSVKWNDYQNNNEKKFRKVILILKDYDTERPYPIFLRYFLIDKNLPNEFQVKPHGNSKGSSSFYPTKKSVLTKIKKEVSNSTANVAKKYNEMVRKADSLVISSPRNKRQLYNQKYLQTEYIYSKTIR